MKRVIQQTMIGYVAQPITNVMWDKGIVTLIVIVLEIWFVVSTTVLLEILQWIAVEDHEYVYFQKFNC